MSILVTGGTGYIGSHAAVLLLQNGYDVVLADNLSNSDAGVHERIIRLAGKNAPFYPWDLCSQSQVREIFARENISAVMHFAGLKAVGESVALPLSYYRNNLVSTMNLLQVMEERGVKKLIFSSSATVYGDPATVPLTEAAPTGPTNPYGQTKLMQEQIMRDLGAADPAFSIALLRYFNPVGAHASGVIGETPRGIPNNLMPYIAQVAAGEREHLNIFGNDYPTPDGTGVRDYIHVMDLVEGHLAALKHIERQRGIFTWNLGTGRGYSVLEMVNAFAAANRVRIPYKIAPRRPGDIAACYADPTQARQELNWQATRTLEDMCRDTWRYQRGQG